MTLSIPSSLAVSVLLALAAPAQEGVGEMHLTRFGEGAGPIMEGAGVRLLDAEGTPLQSNAVAFDRGEEGAFETTTLRCRLRVLEGGDGGAIAFLNTAEYGVRGPAPFVPSWVEPNLRRSFAVGIDVHNPPNEEPFGPWGNYQGLPQREVSLHWDGRELVKRVAPEEFRGDWNDWEVTLEHVVGGAEVSVHIGAEPVYERYFVPGMLPYEARLAFGAGTREDATTELDVADVVLEHGEPAAPRRAPLHVQVFDHVLTDNATTAYQAEVELPPLAFELGRVILTLDIHDAGPDWDEWDRNGEISVFDAEGRKWPIVPFITSYRTECHWQVDVTHFRPLLAGPTRFEVAAGTGFYKDRGFKMSVGLDFHHGRPALEPFGVEPIWVGSANYRSADNHFQDFFEPRRVAIDEAARAARLFTTTTGHSQVGEFTPSRRAVVFRPDADASTELRFENTLWKTDCYLNPNRPQFGTWKYSRAGWAPGDVVHPWWIDLSGTLQPGKTALLRYEPQPYDFSDEPQTPSEGEINQASHVVRSYLILYREPRDTIPVPVLQVTNVAGDSHASHAGLREGDFLASYGGQPLRRIEDLRAAIAAAEQAGQQEIALVAYRGAERLEVTVGPGRVGVNLAER